MADMLEQIRQLEEMPEGWSVVQKAVEFFKGCPGPFRSYQNPQRSDGVFIGQDRCIDPEKDYYYSVGCGTCHHKNWEEVGIKGATRIYPPVPQSAICLPFQVSHEDAKQILDLLNR